MSKQLFFFSFFAVFCRCKTSKLLKKNLLFVLYLFYIIIRDTASCGSWTEVTFHPRCRADNSLKQTHACTRLYSSSLQRTSQLLIYQYLHNLTPDWSPLSLTLPQHLTVYITGMFELSQRVRVCLYNRTTWVVQLRAHTHTHTARAVQACRLYFSIDKLHHPTIDNFNLLLASCFDIMCSIAIPVAFQYEYISKYIYVMNLYANVPLLL